MQPCEGETGRALLRLHVCGQEVTYHSSLDVTRHKRLKNAKRSKWDTNEDIAGLSGNLSPTHRPIDEVHKDHLSDGLTFPNCDIIILRVAEEANLRHIFLNEEE